MRLSDGSKTSDYLDRALIEYSAASFHFDQAGNERYLARVENNLGYLFFTIGRYEDAHAMNVNTIRRWMLTDDKSLTIEMNVEGPNVNLHHRRVFVRK